jgi:O-antigen/teichoic acid export membrane protein
MIINTAKDSVIRQRIILNTASNYIGKFITLGTWFLLTPFILQRLGESTYGLWALVGSAVGYGSLFDFGIGSAIIKYVAEYRAQRQTEQARSLIATALCLYSVLGLVVIALSVAIAPIFPELFNVSPGERTTAIRLVLLMGLGIGIAIPCTAPMVVLWGLQRFDIANLITIVATFLSAAATVVVLLTGGGVLGMVGANIVVTLMVQGLTIWFIQRIAPELRFGWGGARRHLVRTVMSFSWSLFVIKLGGRLQTKTDEIVIATFLPVSSITPYAITRRLGEVAAIVADQFMKVLMPLASELHAEKDQLRMRSLYITSSRITLAILLPVGCALALLAQPILTIWVGATYEDHAHLVGILTFASIIDASQWPASSILQGMERHRPLAVMSVISGLANLILSIALIHGFGLTGVALGTVIPTSVVCLGFILPYTTRVLGVRVAEALKDIFLPALLPVIPMVVLLYVLQHAIKPSSFLSIMVVAGISLLVYAIGYLGVGASKIELETYRSLAFSTIRFAEVRLKRS